MRMPPSCGLVAALYRGVSMAATMTDDGARGLTIEEVFNSLSQWKASGGVSSLPRVHLTPRSAQACLQEGVDPEVRE